MELYYIPVSTYSQKALIAFHEKGVEFESKHVDLMSPEGIAAYREIYPIGKVPLFKPEPDYMVPESSIIIEYLEDHFPGQGTQLIPSDRHEARRTRFMDRMNDLYLMNNTGLLFWQNMKPEAARDQERIEEAKRQLGTCLGYLEKNLADKTWMMGDNFTMADCSALPALWLARISHPYDDFTNVKAYFERGSQRPAVKRVFDDAQPMLEQFMQSLNAA